MIRGGYRLKIAVANLTNREYKVQEVEEGFAIENIGGRGWGARILYDSFSQRIDAFDPMNRLVIASGPLSGLLVPCSGKLSISAISPATGLYGDSNVGGGFAPTLKRAGFDALIVDGIAREPTYILIEDGWVGFKDAKHLWGKFTMDTEAALKRDEGREASIIAIGPAGENLVKIACIGSDFGRQAGRTGMGAVMGHKRLKAVVVRGSEDIPVAEPEVVKKLWDECEAYITGHHEFDIMTRMGTMKVVEWANEMSCLPTRNFLQAQYERASEIDGKAMEKRTKVGSKGCYLCSMKCGQISEAYGVRVEGPEYETAAMIGSNCALPSIEDVVRANYACDQFGLDSISAGNIAAFAMECFERGLIDKRDTDGLELRFGNTDALIRLLEMMAYRRGFGALLAEGVAHASRRIGKGSERFAMHVKGLEISGYDVRAAPAMALAYATCDIGAHHNRAWAITYDIQVGREGYGEDKVKRVIYLQHVRPMFDCLGVCRFPWVEVQMDLEYYPKFYEAITGVRTTLNDLLRRSETVWNIVRLISLRQGLKPGSDWLPDRVFDDPIPDGPLKGSALRKDEFKKMVVKYYELRGWDSQGIPTKAKLRELGLG